LVKERRVLQRVYLKRNLDGKEVSNGKKRQAADIEDIVSNKILSKKEEKKHFHKGPFLYQKKAT